MSESIPESFKGKLGPLPVWAWGAIIGVIVIAYVWFSGRTDESPDAETETAATPTPTIGLGDAIDGAFLPGTANGGGGRDTDIPESVDTNTAWGFRAVAALIGKGTAPLTAQAAISKYLDETTLTAAEGALVNTAIGLVGQPPESVGIPKVSAPTPTVVYTKYVRKINGQIYGVTAEGVETAITDAQYIALGMPALAYDLLPWKYHTAKGNTTTLASIAARYNTTTERLIVLNRYKTGITIKKGTKVKVPSK